MVQYENGEYVPCTYRVTLQNRGKEEIHYTDLKTYWEDMVAKHDHLTNLSFGNISLTTEQQDRLQKVQNENIPQGFLAEVREYMENGNFPEGYNHALKDIKLEKENKRVEQLEKANGIGQKGEKGIANRIDNLEQRVQEIEDSI